jgi:hypothetical protein
MTVGITRLITGRITRFSVATLPAEVAPDVASIAVKPASDVEVEPTETAVEPIVI